MVVAFHFLCCFAPQAVPDYSSRVPLWVDTPLGLAVHGSFAVSIFFVLSGFVLGAASSRAAGLLWVSILLRWVRLAIPATVSVVLAWLLFTAMPNALLLLDSHIPSAWHQFSYQGEIPSFSHALVEGMFKIFVNMPSPGAFNNVLWTMKFEFFGSVGVYVTYRITAARYRLFASGAIGFGVLLFQLPMPYLAFALGAVAYELTNRVSASAFPHRPAAMFVLGIFLAFPASGFVHRWRGGSLPYYLQPGESGSMIGSVAAFLIVISIVRSKAIAKPLESFIPQFLGRVSFPLYLIHAPLICTAIACAVTRLEWFKGWQLFSIAMLALPLSLALALAFEKFIDAPVLNALGRIKRALYERRIAPTAAN